MIFTAEPNAINVNERQSGVVAVRPRRIKSVHVEAEQHQTVLEYPTLTHVERVDG